MNLNLLVMWEGLFLISIAQSIFLLSLMIVKIKEKALDFYLVAVLLAALSITNVDFYFTSSGAYRWFPYAFGSSFGLMLLFGPIFYLYTQSSINPGIAWRPRQWLHFLPYGINFLLNIPIYATASPQKIQFITTLVENGIELRVLDKVVIGIQCVHFLVYLIITQRSLKTLKPAVGQTPHVVASNKKIEWFTLLFYVLLSYEVIVFLLLLLVLGFAHLYIEINYTYTLLTSAIIYILAYAVVINPDLLTPGFRKRYKNSREIDDREADLWMERLLVAMTERKVYKNPELNLEILAKETQIPKNQLSRLINERLEKSFNDYVNEFRIREFISLYNTPEYKAYNIYGIALEAGFNNKSTFNAAFKKSTGKTPTEFRKALELARDN